ncbi:MAG: hypothetical protein ABJL71_16290 [Cyclobacteriaceae bacterium]|uniref:hypothetical protein n=1 Tax=Reichenbachiella sp. TaxID=2184521 RepID=UPI0032668EA6
MPGSLEVGFDYHWGLPRNHNDIVRAYVENHQLFGLDRTSSFSKQIRDVQDVQGLLEERVDDYVNAILIDRVLHFIRENKENPFFL